MLTCSSILWMVLVRRPNSTTGQNALMKRASDVPPSVESDGVTPVTSNTAWVRIESSCPGSVRKALLGGSNVELVVEAVRLEELRRELPHLGLQGLRRVPVVKADIEHRLGPDRDDVGGGIADVDAGHLEIRRREIGAAEVERLVVEPRQHGDETFQRILGEMRIGDVALHAGHLEPPVQAAAPADLDGFAEPRGVGRLADQRSGPAARRWPPSSRAPCACR